MRPRAPVAASGDPWAPYVPDEALHWCPRRVVHLHRHFVTDRCGNRDPIDAISGERATSIAHSITTRPGRSSPSGSLMVIERSRKARMVSTLVRRCSVIAETVNSLWPAANARGSRI